MRSALADEGRCTAELTEEAHLASGLSRPNVVSVLDFDRDNAGRPYLVMEYVDGIDLSKLVETGLLPYPVAIFIVRAGEEALVELPRRAVDVERAVPADAAPMRVVSTAASWCSSTGRVDAPSHACADVRPNSPPWGAVVVLVEERQQARLNVVQRGQRAEVVEAARAERAPNRSILPRVGASPGCAWISVLPSRSHVRRSTSPR
ncbi:MAG TPA: hypothetical protein VN253_11435 [Kofleriaceae bacterium]|nr:hypothetical protein [Kofleriaceae bacterium]